MKKQFDKKRQNSQDVRVEDSRLYLFLFYFYLFSYF